MKRGILQAVVRGFETDPESVQKLVSNDHYHGRTPNVRVDAFCSFLPWQDLSSSLAAKQSRADRSWAEWVSMRASEIYWSG